MSKDNLFFYIQKLNDISGVLYLNVIFLSSKAQAVIDWDFAVNLLLSKLHFHFLVISLIQQITDDLSQRLNRAHYII